jgi:hypothetical protein
VLSPLLAFGLSLMAGDLRGVRLASSMGFNRDVWFRLNRRRFRRLVKQIMSGATTGRKVARKARRRRAQAKPAKSGQPQIIAVRIQDQVRWPWAQVTVKVGGRKILASLVRSGRIWKVHDLQLKLAGLTMSVKKLLALGL